MYSIGRFSATPPKMKEGSAGVKFICKTLCNLMDIPGYIFVSELHL